MYSCWGPTLSAITRTSARCGGTSFASTLWARNEKNENGKKIKE
jgi:hypothetical protein